MSDELKRLALTDLGKTKHNYGGSLPIHSTHICFDKGHSFYLVAETDNGRSKFGEHKCSRCGWVEPFQYDYNPQ